MHAMVDLETLGVRPDAAIIQVGAVLFEPVTGGKVLNGQAFNMFVIPDDRATVDMSTVAWWLRQSTEAQKRIADGITDSAQQEDQVLDSLTAWPYLANGYSWEAVTGVWANGPTFDLALLQNAYRRHGKDVPWHFRSPRDMRTLFDMVGGAPDVDNARLIAHDAVDDCVHQIMQVQKAMGMIARAS